VGLNLDLNLNWKRDWNRNLRLGLVLLILSLCLSRILMSQFLRSRFLMSPILTNLFLRLGLSLNLILLLKSPLSQFLMGLILILILSLGLGFEEVSRRLCSQTRTVVKYHSRLRCQKDLLQQVLSPRSPKALLPGYLSLSSSHCGMAQHLGLTPRKELM